MHLKMPSQVCSFLGNEESLPMLIKAQSKRARYEQQHQQLTA